MNRRITNTWIGTSAARGHVRGVLHMLEETTVESSALAIFVPYSPPGEPWVVRRAHTVVETWPSREEAVMSAFRLASDLCNRMGSDVRIEVQEANGAWRALSPVHPHKSARLFSNLRYNKPPSGSKKSA